VLATSAVVVAAQPPPGNATATAKPPRFDVQEVSTQLFLDIAGARALRSACCGARVFARRSAEERSRGAVIMLVCRFVGLVFKGASRGCCVVRGSHARC
jgi:hypothetical protein